MGDIDKMVETAFDPEALDRKAREFRTYVAKYKGGWAWPIIFWGSFIAGCYGILGEKESRTVWNIAAIAMVAVLGAYLTQAIFTHVGVMKKVYASIESKFGKDAEELDKQVVHVYDVFVSFYKALGEHLEKGTNRTDIIEIWKNQERHLPYPDEVKNAKARTEKRLQEANS